MRGRPRFRFARPTGFVAWSCGEGAAVVAPVNRIVVIGAFFWIAKLEYFVAEYLSIAAWPGYSLRDSTISVLGTAASPRAAVLNIGLIVAGILTVAGTLLTWSAWPDTRATRIALWLIVVAGIGTIGVGVFPVDGNEPVHIATTLATFVPGGIGVIALGIIVLPRHPVFGAATILFGAVSLGALALFAGHIYLGLGRGGMERVAGYASVLWYVFAGTFLLLTPRQSARTGQHAADRR